MRIISKKEFLCQFASHGLNLDERYQPPRTLVFPATYDLRWSWEIPTSPKDLPRFVTSLFEACDELDSFYLFPRSGAWRSGDTLKLFQMAAVFSHSGCRPDADDVLVFSVDEIDAVETLFSIALIFGGTVSDDVFAVPSHGKIVLYADHHEAVHAEFGDGGFMNAYLPQIPEFTPQ
jgi:hypothetical protein